MKRKGTPSSKYSKAKRTRTTGGFAKSRATIYKSPALLNRELDPNDYKITDSQQNGTAISSGGSIFDLYTAMAPGTGYISTFVGAKVNPVGVNVNWECVCADNTNIMRLVLFQWMDSSVPVPSGILQGNALSTVNVTNRENIRVLRDELVSMALPDATGFAIASGKWYVPSRKMVPSQYNSGLAIFQKGGLYLLCMSDSGIIAHPTVSFYTRVTFLDS